MRKVKIVFALYLFSAQGILAQNKIVLPGDPGAAGTANVQKEAMINGKPYSQYKAEQDAIKKQLEIKKIATVKSADVVMYKSTDASPAPARVQPKKNTEPENPVLPAKTEVKEVESAVTTNAGKEPAIIIPEVPSQLRIPEAKEWTGRSAETSNGAKTAPGVVMPNADPGQPLKGEDLTKARPIAPKATEKPASRSGTVVENSATSPESARKKAELPNLPAPGARRNANDDANNNGTAVPPVEPQKAKQQ